MSTVIGPPSLSSHMPLYLQVQETLQEMIENVEYGPGEQIPSERELSDMLGVSRMTIRRAVENLIQVGLLERRSTSGTYVRQPQIVRHVGSQYPVGLTQMLQHLGAHVGARLLTFDTIRAPHKIATYLGLRLGEPVVVLRRLRTANALPFCIETSHVPAEFVPGLASGDVEGDISFYGLLKERYGISMVRSEGTVKISRCLPEETDLLGLNAGDPVLFMQAVICDTLNRNVEYIRSVNHPDRVIFRSYRQLG
ncbi:MAG: GntR family transcriptional regulator [Anaerolineae bacterium]|nr:GntR family transcriptional regulator [Anaerolineae bacterium]